MSRETLEAFRQAIDEGLELGHESVRIDVGPERTRLVWSQAGVEVDTGDGIVVLLCPAVFDRLVSDALRFAFTGDERMEWVDPKPVTP